MARIISILDLRDICGLRVVLCFRKLELGGTKLIIDHERQQPGPRRRLWQWHRVRLEFREREHRRHSGRHRSGFVLVLFVAADDGGRWRLSRCRSKTRGRPFFSKSVSPGHGIEPHMIGSKMARIR